MKISARNVLKGKVKQVKHGAINTEVIVGFPGGTEIVSVITKESAEHLELAKGKEVYAVIKASNVMIAVEQLAGHGYEQSVVAESAVDLSTRKRARPKPRAQSMRSHPRTTSMT